MAGCVSATEPRRRPPFAGAAVACGLAAVALGGLLAGSLPAARADARTDLPRARPTIVSLNPCADAILAEVADPAQVLAISHYSVDPRSASMPAAQAARYRTTRGTVEEVVALHPDLVIDGSFVAPATASAYRRLGLRLETVGNVDTVADARAQVRRLAAMAGHPERGEALLGRIDAALAAAAPAPGPAPIRSPIRAVMWESGGMVPGDNTLIADLLRRTGFSKASAARGYRQADLLPLERLIADPPQVIFTAVAGEGQGADADRMLAHPALATLAGVRRAPFAANLLYCAGPTVIRAADRLAAVRRQGFGQ
ncbi:MAG: ABC transporter substrate-binding protein [Sphingomonadales bacterium]|nr:ABC transporter substrate-binding protein [Sphingomonadales bacterium]